MPALRTVRCSLGSFPNVSTLDVSPDGTQALIVRKENARVRVILVALASGQQRQLFTATGSLPTQPWSPDGTMIAFVLNGDTLATVSVTDGRIRPVYSPVGRFTFDSWAPDNQRVLITFGQTLRIVSSIGEWQDVATGRGGSFSPSGRLIAYYGNDSQVHEIGVDGTEYMTAAPYGVAIQSRITWSANGDALAFEQKNLTGPAQLIQSYGNDNYRVLQDGGVVFQAPLWYGPWLVWSEARQTIAGQTLNPYGEIVLDPVAAAVSNTRFPPTASGAWGLRSGLGGDPELSPDRLPGDPQRRQWLSGRGHPRQRRPPARRLPRRTEARAHRWHRGRRLHQLTLGSIMVRLAPM